MSLSEKSESVSIFAAVERLFLIDLDLFDVLAIIAAPPTATS
jgi:hypothetical protein